MLITLIFGILLGVFICLFIPPKELAVKIIHGTLTVCKFLTEKGQEQLKKLEEEQKEEQKDDNITA